MGNLVSNVKKRLKRLTDSSACSCEQASEYADELKGLAEKNISKNNALKKRKFFKALADVTRLRILGLLAEREMCVCEVMVALDLNQSTASHHLRILENVNLVTYRREGKWIFYALENPGETAKLLRM